MSAKEEILDIVEKFPPNASFDSIAQEVIRLSIQRRDEQGIAEDSFNETPEERAATLAAIREGQEAIAAGHFRTHEEVKQLVRSWASKCVVK